MHGDTAKPKGEAYKTPAGHIVYGGGGITPDIFVPFDTTTQSQEVLQLYAKNTLNNFIYNYYIEHKNFFSAFTSIQDFIQRYMPANQEWQSLSAFALKDGINLNKLPPAAKTFLQHKMQALMARQIWRSEGYFEVSNASDAMLEKAEQVF